jgi:hypothetical protein
MTPEFMRIDSIYLNEVINDFIVSMSKRRFGGKRIEVEGFWVI